LDPVAVLDGEWGRLRDGVLDGDGDHRMGRGCFGVNSGRPTVSNVDFVA